MRLRLALALVPALAAPLVTASPATAACATATKTVKGSISGQDRRFVDVLIGFDVVDKNGQHLGATQGQSSFGCTGQKGYGLTLRVNRDLPADGSTTKGTKTWTAVVPANATHMYIETYPQAAGYGGTSQIRYGSSMRRKIPVPYPATVNLRMPLICTQGGQTGSIAGVVTKGGTKVAADRVAAWSLATDNNTPSPVMGWNIGTAKSDGTYTIPNLASGQTYTVQVREAGALKQFYKIQVNSCRATKLNAAF
jgi:hypothetical protein